MSMVIRWMWCSGRGGARLRVADQHPWNSKWWCDGSSELNLSHLISGCQDLQAWWLHWTVNEYLSTSPGDRWPEAKLCSWTSSFWLYATWSGGWPPSAAAGGAQHHCVVIWLALVKGISYFCYFRQIVPFSSSYDMSYRIGRYLICIAFWVLAMIRLKFRPISLITRYCRCWVIHMSTKCSGDV